LTEKINAMKKLLLLSTLCFSLIKMNAQTAEAFGDKSHRFQAQIGFDATSFLKQFVVLNNSSTPQTSPFNFNAKFLAGLRTHPALLIGPRLGIGFASSHNYSNNSDQTSERSDDSKNKSMRIGIELQQLISKHWTVYYGLDYINQTATNTTVTTFTSGFNGQNIRTETIANDKRFGYGPVLGVQFNINKWLCLNTEMAFYSLQGKGGVQTTSSNPQNTTPETFTDSKQTQIILPFFVNFNIVF
jgi:hypothetical protein